jgi:hypothetical protein
MFYSRRYAVELMEIGRLVQSRLQLELPPSPIMKKTASCSPENKTKTIGKLGTAIRKPRLAALFSYLQAPLSMLVSNVTSLKEMQFVKRLQMLQTTFSEEWVVVSSDSSSIKFQDGNYCR